MIAPLPEAKIFLKKVNKMEAFPYDMRFLYIFFYFLAVLTRSPEL